MMKKTTYITALFYFLAMAVIPVIAQSTSFTYQGTLADGSQPASGSYDFEFRLYDSLTGGTQIGSSVITNGVNVADGVFTATLDFGGQFPGANRWLEILVRQSTGANANDAVLGATMLSPRQRLASAPYAVKSLSADTAITATNATQLGGVSSSEYVVTTDPRMTDSRPPTAGSDDYIQNSPAFQPGSSFFVDNGKAGSFDAQSKYKLLGQTILQSQLGSGNLFVGRMAGNDSAVSSSENSFFGEGAGSSINNLAQSNSFFGTGSGGNTVFGDGNTFLGRLSGVTNVGGSRNTLLGERADVTVGNLQFATAVGAQAVVSTSNTVVLGRPADTVLAPGSLTVSGTSNSGTFNASSQYRIGNIPILSNPGIGNFFAGNNSGIANTTGDANAFLGFEAGKVNTTGSSNTFGGYRAGFSNTDGFSNSFYGASSGGANATGDKNSFFGNFAGITNTGGNSNSLFGNSANVGSGNLSFATAIGAESVVSTSNTVVLGRTADRVSMPGTATIGSQTTNYGQLNLNAPSTNANFYMSGDGAAKGINFGVDSTTTAESKLFISQYDGTTYLDRLTISENGEVGINVLGQGGSTSLCRNALNHISTCSSSARYKSNIEDFRFGLPLIRKLRPVSFRWAEGGMPDLGLVAEEVAAVEPLLTTTIDGRVEGVKYDRIGVLLVNAVVELDTRLQKEQEEVRKQQEEIDALGAKVKALEAVVCELKPEAAICKTIDD